ncbi:MAG: S53 family peptidase [Candidatus Acidiferrales bacterium]
MPKQNERVELKGSTRKELPGARRVGPADPNQRVQVTVFLRRGEARPFPAMDELGSRPVRTRRYLSREEFAAAHGARPEDLAAVRRFAEQYGLEVSSESRPRRSVLLTGTVQAFSAAFEPTLGRWEDPTGTYRCRTGALTIPAELDGIIQGVFGLDNRPQAKTHFRIRKKVSAQAAAVSYSPVQVADAYDFPSGSDGSGQCIGIVELGGGYNTQDLQTFFSGLGIAMPHVTAVSVDGATNSPTGDANGPDGEVELDIEVAGAVAPGAALAMYFTPNTDAGFLDALTTAIHDTNLKPSTVSISWGGPESSWTQQALDSFNSACQDAATLGVTVLAASGDDGSSDGVSGGTATVDFPASSPYVLGCGGTKLEVSGSTITSERAWNDVSQNEGATGGGVSEFFAIPTFQANAGVPKAPNGFAGRGVPDVAGDADPETGYNVVVDGQQIVIGGTSAVAPLWAGLVALINQSLGKSAGYLNPLLYTMSVESTMHDITAGNNGAYSAGPGWDACTGLGSPDGSKLLAALKSGGG